MAPLDSDSPRSAWRISTAAHAHVRDGRSIPSELVADLREVRRGEIAAYGELRADEVQERISERAAEVAERVRSFEDGAESDPAAALDAALDLGAEVRWLRWLGESASGELSADPVSFVESELDWVESEAKGVARWDPALELGARVVDETAEGVRRRLLHKKLVRFLDESDVPAGRSSFEEALHLWFAAGESYQVEIEAAARGYSSATPSAASEPSSLEAKLELGEKGVRALKTQRAEFVDRCAKAFGESTPTEKAQFCDRAASDLIDYASAILTDVAGADECRKIPSLRALRDRIDFFFKVVQDDQKALLRKGALPRVEARDLKRKLRRLERIRKRTRNAEREETVYRRLRATFGARGVRWAEMVVLWMIFAFLGIAALEWWLGSTGAGGASGSGANSADSSPGGLGAGGGSEERHPLILWLHLADLILCVGFQVDFFVRWHHARWRGWYFRRHFFLESLPALPYGLLMPALSSVIVVRLFQFQRFLRLPALFRSLRVLAFFVRGADRTVERFRGVLDRDVVLFDLRGVDDAPDSAVENQLSQLAERHRRAFRLVYRDVEWSERAELLRRHAELLGLEADVLVELGVPYRRSVLGGADEIRLDEVIVRCLDCDVTRSMTHLGREGAQRVARWLRFLDVPVFRRAPLVRRIAPAARLEDPGEAVATAIRAIGRVLEDFLGALRFWGDVSGITTGPQILDRIASAMILASKRPAIRLLLLGGLFFLFRGLAHLFGATSEGFGGMLSSVSNRLFEILGVPILVLGSICLVVFVIGLWLKKIAGEALDVHLRTADAHFYTLTKEWKRRRRSEDLDRLFQSVIAPEFEVRPPPSSKRSAWVEFLADETGTLETDAWLPFAGDRDAIQLHYASFLDGPILHRSDGGTSVQLLGNLVLDDIRTHTLSLSRRARRRLEKLNLEKNSLLTLGPYFWFRFITESLSIETAKLVTEYNRTCLPLEKRALATPEENDRLQSFLRARELGDEGAYERRTARREGTRAQTLLTDEFHALHFLTVDPVRDAEVRRRFGDDVFEALRRDRRGVIRDVFGTRPYHQLPRHQRVFNPYRIYHRYFGGARFIFLPLVAVLAAGKLVVGAVRQVAQLVREVIGGTSLLRSQLSRVANFDVAVRKINRMRKPIFMELLELRMAIDIAYLDLRIPGVERARAASDADSTHSYRDDLNFIGAFETERSPLEAFRAEVEQDLRRFRFYLARHGWLENGAAGLFSALGESSGFAEHGGEVLRALATAYVNDHGRLRSRITAPERTREFFARASTERESWGARLEIFVFGGFLWFLPRNRRRRRLFREAMDHGVLAKDLPGKMRRKFLRRFLGAGRAIERAVAMTLEEARCGAEHTDVVLGEMRRVARDYDNWTRKIVTVRAIQTLTVLDVQNYRDLVWSLGEYGETETGAVRSQHVPSLSR